MPVLFHKHDSATCRRCGGELWYAIKEESTGWKVFYQCRSDGGCGYEWMAGRIPMSRVASRDDAFKIAETRAP